MPTRQLFSSSYSAALFCCTTESFALVLVSVHPARAPLTLTQTQRFTAAVAGTTNTGVIWFVDGVRGGNSTMGTISSTGFYRPPGVKGTHTVLPGAWSPRRRRMPRCASPIIPACLPITVIVFVAE